jgi:fatty acyl-CoA reductase
VVCARLGTKDGTYDGQLTSVPPTGEARYQALVDLAEEHGCDLRESIAYADSASDLPMLEAVGFPVAVNPETRLASIARKRGWLVEDFRKSPGMTRRLLPIAPPRTAVR